MTETHTARLFKNGASQAVRLPAEFRFEGAEVFVTRDGSTGDVTLSKRAGAKAWSALLGLLHTVDAPSDFMARRPLNVTAPVDGVFDNEPATPRSAQS